MKFGILNLTLTSLHGNLTAIIADNAPLRVLYAPDH